MFSFLQPFVTCVTRVSHLVADVLWGEFGCKKALNTLAFSASSVYIFPPLRAADQSFLSLPLTSSAITEGFPVTPYSHSLSAFLLHNNVLHLLLQLWWLFKLPSSASGWVAEPSPAVACLSSLCSPSLFVSLWLYLSPFGDGEICFFEYLLPHTFPLFTK